MAKFKVGDRVRRVNNSYSRGGLQIGDIGTVAATEYEYIGLKEFPIPGDSAPYSVSNFDLVGTPALDELEQLIETANAGYRAIERLDKEFAGKIQYHEKIAGESRWSEWCDGETFTQGREIRVKPKFEPFQVNNNQWTVTLQGEFLAIGCQQFDPYVLLQALKSAQDAQVPVGIGGSDREYQVRGGLRGVYWRTFHLSWNDVNKIIEALAKVGTQ